MRSVLSAIDGAFPIIAWLERLQSATPPCSPFSVLIDTGAVGVDARLPTRNPEFRPQNLSWLFPGTLINYCWVTA